MIEAYIQDIIQDLSISQVVASFRVLKTEIGEDDGYIRSSAHTCENPWSCGPDLPGPPSCPAIAFGDGGSYSDGG